MSLQLLTAVLALLAPPVETSETPRTQLYVRTVPSGATIVVDGQPLGKSDALFIIPAGTHKLSISLDGREPVARDVKVASGEVTRLEVQLQKPAIQPLNESEQKIAQAIVDMTEVEFLDCWLIDCLDTLKDLHKIPIQFDRAALKQAGIDHEKIVITCIARDMTLRSVLKLILQPHGLTAVIRFEVLLITTSEEAKRLVSEGAIDIATLPSERAAANAKRIAEGLKKPVELATVETPLRDTADYLSLQTTVPIFFSNDLVEAAQKDPQYQCTINLKNVRLDSALQLVLRNMGLTFEVEEEYLLITRPKKQPARFEGSELKK